jgi:CBS-domain-containing membrane protein
MTRDLVTCSADDALDKAMQLMAKNQLRRIPVIDDDGAITGIIAQADIAMEATSAEHTGKVVEKISRPRVPISRSAVA